MTIQIHVTRERYEEIISIDDDMHFFELTNREAYDYMINFVINGDKEYIPSEEARKLFKKVPRKELSEYIIQFIKAIGDAFINPPSGADSAEPS